MFQIGEVFEGDLKLKAAPVSGTIREFQDRTKIEIIDVSENVFTAKISFFYNYDLEIYNNNTISVGLFNPSNCKFKILEALFELPVTLENKDTIEVSLMKGKKCKNGLHIRFLETSNRPQPPTGLVVFAYEAKLNKIA